MRSLHFRDSSSLVFIRSSFRANFWALCGRRVHGVCGLITAACVRVVQHHGLPRFIAVVVLDLFVCDCFTFIVRVAALACCCCTVP